MRRTPFLAAALISALISALTVLIGLAPPALAGRAKPGAACDTAGRTTTIDTRDGRQTYRCEQRPGEDCPHWHWVYNPGVPRGQWTPRPVGPCPTCPTPGASTPTSTVTSTITSTVTADPTRTTTTPPPAAAAFTDSGQLPITDGGTDPFVLLGVAGALLFLGGALVLIARNVAPLAESLPPH